MRGSNMIVSAALALGLFLPDALSADTLAIATSTKAFQGTDNNPHDIPLDNGGSTSLTFVTNGGILIISYNAECLAQGPEGSWLSISIVVDGQSAQPRSGTDFAFCSPTGANNQGFVAAIRTSVAKVRSGTHTVRVVGTGVNTTLWQVDDSTFTVSITSRRGIVS